MRILEIGASWQLDKPESENWEKMYHNRVPNYHNGLYQFGQTDDAIDTSMFDVVIFSLTSYDMDRFDPTNPEQNANIKRERVFSCLENTTKYMSLFCCKCNPGTRFILIGSISANDYHPYKTRPYYSMLKSAQRGFFKNMAENNLDKQFLELSFDTIKDDVAIKTVMNFINQDKFNKQYQIIQCDGISPKEPNND